MNANLLCERCGYEIGGLDDDRACPECGLDVSASRPEARAGSAWQQTPSTLAWWRTARALARPQRLFSDIRVDGRKCRTLLMINLTIAAAPMAATPTYAVSRLSRASRMEFGLTDSVLTLSFAAWIAWAGAFWGLWLLTQIEWVGIRLIGKQRGWRITKDVAGSVCAHGSFGWVVAGVLSLAGLAAGVWIEAPWSIAPGAWAVALSGLGFFSGLMLFESLIYVGVRACRFANPPNEPEPPAE